MLKPFTLVAALASVLLPSFALADPPAHAPAHGWRKKHDPNYMGYTGTQWERDYGVSSGRCNREEIGAVLGGVAGGAIGSQTSDEHRAVGTIVGAAIGALLGSAIGRELDDADRGCVGHALEIGEVGRRITWSNPKTGVTYVLVPEKGNKSRDKACRNFVLTAKLGKKQEQRHRTACQKGTGRWEIG